MRASVLRSYLVVMLLSSALGLRAQDPAPTELETKLQAIIKDFRGDVGIYVRHPGRAVEIAIRADEVFPTASLVKVPILAALFDRVSKGEVDYHASLTYDAKRLYPGEDLLGSFKDGEKIALTKLCLLMTAFSDNTASLWCQELAGTGTRINAWLESNGFTATRVNSRTEGREEAKAAYGWGQTTPREISRLVWMIRERKAGSEPACDEMYRLLSKTYWDGEAVSQIPPHVSAASKQGAVNRSRSEVVLVNAPSGDYVFSVITKNQKDESWTASNEGFVLLRRVSRMLYEHFEPKDSWRPAIGAEKF